MMEFRIAISSPFVRYLYSLGDNGFATTARGREVSGFPKRPEALARRAFAGRDRRRLESERHFAPQKSANGFAHSVSARQP
jgi:hypothetical protein